MVRLDQDWKAELPEQMGVRMVRAAASSKRWWELGDTLSPRSWTSVWSLNLSD